MTQGVVWAEVGALEPEFLGLSDLQLESWSHIQLCGFVHLSVSKSLPDLGIFVIFAFQGHEASPGPSNQILTQH